MKTSLEHFSTLKQPYRDQAILNFVNRRIEREDFDFDKKNLSLEGALIKGFNWSESPEGSTYWSDVHNNVKSYVVKSLPEPEQLDGYEVHFHEDGSIKVGCQHIQLSQLETILSKARQAKEG